MFRPPSESLAVNGRYTKLGELPLPQAEARRLFEDGMAAFLGRMDDVAAVTSPAGRGRYLVSHHPIGGLNFYVTLVYALRVEPRGDGLQLDAFDFDPATVPGRHPVVKGVVAGQVDFTALAADRTAARLDFTLAIELPLYPALRLLPRALVQSTADGLMSMKLAGNVDAAYRKTLEALPG